MGEARSRGTKAERREQSLDKMLDSAEIIITLSEKDGGISFQCLPRDEEPNAQSLAVILASFFDSNLEALTRAAVQAKLQSEQPQAEIRTKDGDISVIATRAIRSVTTVGGGLAKGDAVELLGPDGRPL